MCEYCNIGNGNLTTLYSETINFGDTEFSLDLLFGIKENGQGNMRAVLDTGYNTIKEIIVIVNYCPMCGRKLEGMEQDG